MDAKLHLVKGNPKGKLVEVPTGKLTVGRAEDSDLIIASTRVSRHHCEIANEENRLVIRDKKSANGTFVNRKRVQEHVLQPGDEVRIGPLTFLVEINGKREPTAKPKTMKKKPAAKSQTAPSEPKMPPPGPPRSPDNIALSLERLANKRTPQEEKSAPAPTKKKGADVLHISDKDLIDSDQ